MIWVNKGLFGIFSPQYFEWSFLRPGIVADLVMKDEVYALLQHHLGSKPPLHEMLPFLAPHSFTGKKPCLVVTWLT